MFSENVQLHYTGATCKTETRGEDTTAVTAVSLVLDSLTPELARDLSDDIEDLCFSDRGRIRDEIRQLKIRLREPQQQVTVRMAVDTTEPHVVLRNVRIPSIRITKRGEDPAEEVDRKSKKVAPTGETLRATLDCLMLPEQSAEVRRWLTMMPGKTFFFAFAAEQQPIDFGPDHEDDDDADESQEGLDFGRPNKRKKGDGSDPCTPAKVAAALQSVGIELRDVHLKALSDQQRGEIIVWVGDCETAKAAGTEAPPPPDYVLRPQTLGVAPAPDPEAGNPEDDKTPEPKARKKPAGKFTNKPRLAKGKKR